MKVSSANLASSSALSGQDSTVKTKEAMSGVPHTSPVGSSSVETAREVSTSDARPSSIPLSIALHSSMQGNITPSDILYIVASEESESSNVTTFFDPNDMVTLSNQWYQSSWFGIFYNLGGEQWIYHQHLGWLYLSSIGQDTFWLYDSELGWLFTSKVLYPYFFRDQTQNWLYQLEDSSTFRFWDYATSSRI